MFISICGRRSIDDRRRRGDEKYDERLEGYLDRKTLLLNVGKTKIVRE